MTTENDKESCVREKKLCAQDKFLGLNNFHTKLFYIF